VAESPWSHRARRGALRSNDAAIHDAAIAEIGGHVHSLLRAFAAGRADPHAQDFPDAAEGDAYRDIDREFRGGTVADLHDDRSIKMTRQIGSSVRAAHLFEVIDDGVGVSKTSSKWPLWGASDLGVSLAC
jgi:hypothetical protein